MANHIRYGNPPQYIRRKEDLRVVQPGDTDTKNNTTTMGKAEIMAHNIVHRILTDCGMKHIRLSTKQSLGLVIIFILLFVVVGVVIAVHMGFISNPLKGIMGAKSSPSPTQHLQYFFF